MSTGDQSEYVRGKIAERGVGQKARFMRDGFDRWAESSQPAREGQMEKIPAESQMPAVGGAMTLSKARKLYNNNRLAKHGAGFKEELEKIKEQVKSILNVYRKISKFIDDFQQDLKDEIIENPEVAASKPKLVNFANKLLGWLESLKVYKNVLDELAKLAESYGMGRKRRLTGGLAAEDIGKYAKKVFEIYSFVKSNAGNVRIILGLKSLQPIGKQILDAINPLLTAIIGPAPAGSGKKHICNCGGAQVEFTGGVMKYAVGKHSIDEGGLFEEENLDYDDYRSVFHERSMGQSPMQQKKAAGGMSSQEKYIDEACKQREQGKLSKSEAMRNYLDRVCKPKGQGMGGRKPSARGAIVKKVMAERGLSLPQASKYVKEHGLY